MCSLSARFSQYGLCHRGDVVLVKDTVSNTVKATKLLVLACVSDVPMALMEEWTLKSSDMLNGFSKWSPQNASKILAPLENILDTVTHTVVGDKTVTVLHSPDFR